jgi:phospholipase C
MTLRSALVVSAVLLPALGIAAACSSSSNGGAAATSADAGIDVLQPPPIDRTQTEAQLAPQRAACAFDAGAWPGDTIGTDYPVGSDIPINHIIVLMQENRSFDHYLGRLVAQGYYNAGDFTDAGSGFAHSDELDGPPPGWSMPDGDGGLVAPHADTEHCYSVNHSWQAMHDDYDNGLLDHFVTQNNPDGQRVMFYEDDTVIPFYYGLASTFSVGDRYFCSVLSSTWPNRYFMMAATSFGIGDNSFDTNDTEASPAIQIFNELEAAGRTWKDYTDGPHQEEFFSYFGLSASTRAHYGSMSCDLLNDINAGTLPDVSYVMGSEVGESSDEGPSALPGIGGELVEGLVRALFASPSWKDTALFLMYDENGGIADHVPPAPACAPDGIAPHLGDGTPLQGAFDTTGYRVPFIVISPYARKHFVSHVVHDHTSVVRFIESRFGLPAMTKRDANAAPPMEMFDFQNPPFMTPPTIAATTTVPSSILSQCGQTLTKVGCPTQ